MICNQLFFPVEPLFLGPGDDIRHKPVPRWPDRRSYAAHRRDQRRRKNRK